MNLNCNHYVQSAIKAKAPVVAIPVAGRVPFIVDGKRLAAWAKHTRIVAADLQITPSTTTYREVWPARQYDREAGQCRDTYGPPKLEEVRTMELRTLVLTGHAAKSPRIRCRAVFTAIERREALKRIRDWSEKERVRIQKKRMLGELGYTAAERKAMKRAKYEAAGELVETNFRENENKVTTRKGYPLQLPEMPRVQFVAVPLACSDGDVYQFNITETRSGLQVSNGATIEAAILNARRTMQEAGPEKVKAAEERILRGDALAA